MAAYSEYTLSQILQLLAFKYDQVPFWTVEEATDAINEALLMWNLMTGFWKDTVTITTPLTANWDYSLPASIVFGMRAEFNGKPLNLSSRNDMDSGHPGWQSQTTADGGNVPTEPKNWLPLSIDMIAIWPADAAGGNTLTINGVAATPQLTSAGDFIDIGAEELGVILGYALHILSLKEGGLRFAATGHYFTEFLQSAAEENDQLTQSSMFREFLGLDSAREANPTRGKPTAYDNLSGRKP
jgi:hypothetical protein